MRLGFNIFNAFGGDYATLLNIMFAQISADVECICNESSPLVLYNPQKKYNSTKMFILNLPRDWLRWRFIGVIACEMCYCSATSLSLVAVEYNNNIICNIIVTVYPAIIIIEIPVKRICALPSIYNNYYIIYCTRRVDIF